MPHSLRFARITEGNEGILRDTIPTIKAWINEYNPLVRLTAEKILHDTNTVRADIEDRARALFDWVRRNMVYTPDMGGPRLGSDTNVEDELRRPDLLIHMIENKGYAHGDCDDYVIVVGALWHSIGVEPIHLKVVSTRPDRGFNHIYLLMRGIPADPIVPHPMGWEVPRSEITASGLIPL
jgi:hypothetical protein